MSICAASPHGLLDFLYERLGKTHIKKVFFLVVGPLRGGGGVKPP